ncbi:hypothetical protein SAMN06297144_1407 [Sphingomonas guangdongensis]|uniref:Glycosyltransferase 2-like domain-containing protein n=1 Tax=Sphingomonas guangdongensis TaxID=1141890 RepID=A0A285QGP4_9SPHN|nr:glycosyltransferase family 2 protein [Sphingomonas guangdongensis]SOB81120.1 hypothetical protein SAMN06297144_1407 [Sphingomonas guangdongensis]
MLLIGPRVGVVIVNWNGWRDTLDAFASLQRAHFSNWTLFVVDNASSDESVARLSDLSPRLRLIRSTANLGFAGGCNAGIAAARAAEMEAVFLLNSDAAVRADTLDALVTAHAGAPDAVLGAVVRYADGGKLQFFGSRTASGTGAPEWFDADADAHELDRSLIPSDFAFGAALFAPVTVFDRVGPFDERFFLTYEETDWCYRARSLGHRCFIVRDAVVDHLGSASLGAATSPLQAYFLQRNRLLFWEKHAGTRRLLRGAKTDLRWLARGFRDDARALVRGRSIAPTRRALFAAWRDYLLRRFGDCPASVRRLRTLPGT